MPKTRTSAIDDLPECAQSRILSWLECHPTRVVVDMIAQSPPEGYDLKTHVTTLRRFYARYQASSSPAELEIAKLFVPEGVPAPLEGATDHLLTEWAFQIATSPHRTNGAFKALARWCLQAREQKQRETQLHLNKERLALEREKFEFNAARQALLHHDRLGKILDDRASDDEQKIYAAREQLFGKLNFPAVEPRDPSKTASFE